MIEEAARLRADLDEVKGSYEIVMERRGYTLRFAKLKYNALSVLIKSLFGTEIRVAPGQCYKEIVASIAHEICHDLFHADCIAYRRRRAIEISIEEGQAEMFAAIVVFPSLKEYETVDEFMRTSGVTSRLAEMRIAFFEKYGW